MLSWVITSPFTPAGTGRDCARDLQVASSVGHSDVVEEHCSCKSTMRQGHTSSYEYCLL